MGQHVIYGLGGYDPTKPDDNIIQIIEITEDEGGGG